MNRILTILIILVFIIFIIKSSGENFENIFSINKLKTQGEKGAIGNPGPPGPPGKVQNNKLYGNKQSGLYGFNLDKILGNVVNPTALFLSGKTPQLRVYNSNETKGNNSSIHIVDTSNNFGNTAKLLLSKSPGKLGGKEENSWSLNVDKTGKLYITNDTSNGMASFKSPLVFNKTKDGKPEDTQFNSNLRIGSFTISEKKGKLIIKKDGIRSGIVIGKHDPKGVYGDDKGLFIGPEVPNTGSIGSHRHEFDDLFIHNKGRMRKTKGWLYD